MSRWTIELDGGAHFEVDARSAQHARRIAKQEMPYSLPIIEVRPFAAKSKKIAAGDMPEITVKPDPFEKLRSLLP
jgi:hypothetical protein